MSQQFIQGWINALEALDAHGGVVGLLTLGTFQ